jgi:hypothetical protein
VQINNLRDNAPARRGPLLGLNQEALRSRLQLELDLVTADTMTVVRPLSKAQLAWKPPSGGWSIGQVLEHIVLSADTYLDKLRGLVYFHHAAHAELGGADWEPSIGGWVLVAGLRKDFKMPSPKLWQVNGEAREDVVTAFLHQQDSLTRLLRASAALEWSKVRLSSPVSTLLRINLGDAFTALVVHAQRHVRQIQRIRDEPSFPLG